MATRLKDNYKSNDPVASIDADWLNTVARWLNTINVNGGPRFATPFDLRLYLASGEGGSSCGSLFAWKCAKATANTVTVTPGDIELGPDTVLAWTDEGFTGEKTTVTVTAGNPTWWIWVNVDISVTPPTAVMYDGATITALSSAEKLTTFQKRIAKITSVDNIITEVKCLQCGNITIPRAAG